MKISLSANAKINLFLDIDGRLDNGYHTIQSVMQTVSLCDTVHIEMRPSDKTEISISCTEPSVPTDEKNLAWRAAAAFLNAANECYNVSIHIEKNIPAAGGLAGGSSDAAAVLRGMNELLENRFSRDELCRIGVKIGADIPFCIVGGAKHVSGIGEVLEPMPCMPLAYVVVAHGGEGVSTPAAYAMLDGICGDFKNSGACMDNIISAFSDGNINGICDSMFNLFEIAILPIRPVAEMIKDKTRDAGARGVLMSGSGPSIFGIFDSKEAAQKCANKLTAAGFFAAVATPTEEY